MLISAVMPIMSIYRLPHGQYGYSGHVINLPQDVASFATRLPRLPSELDVIVVKKEGAGQSHRDFRIRRSVVQCALQWLVTHNKYYHANHVHIDGSALEHLPEDGNLSQLTAITVESCATDDPVAIAPTTDSHATSDTSDPSPSSVFRSCCHPVCHRAGGSAAVSGTKAVQLIFICYYDVAFHWRNANQ